MTATAFVQTHGNKAVSGALIVALYVSVIAAGWFLSYLPAQASHMTVKSDTLSVSTPSSASDHTIVFTTDSVIPVGGSISIDFQGISVVFATGSVAFGDLDIASASGDYVLSSVDSGSSVEAGVYGSKVIFRGFDTAIAAGTTLTVQIGKNANGGVFQLTNPTATAGTGITVASFNASNVQLDAGTTFVAIVPRVQLQATVQDQFRFIIGGCTTAACDIDSYSVDTTSTATLANFGTLTAGVPQTMGSSLSVTSNALNGFVVTVEQNHNMIASVGADIDCFKDGTCSSAGTTWTSPLGTAGLEQTYGHLGLHSEDGSGTGVANNASVSTATNGDWFGLTTGTPVEIWDNDGTGDGAFQDTGHIDVGYRIEISSLQESGVYTNRLMYIATPTF